MNHRAAVKSFIFALSSLVVFAGCVTPFLPACLDAAKDPNGEFKYSEKQAAVACSSRAIFNAMPHLVNYDKEKNEWQLNPNGVLTSDLEQVVRDQLKSINGLLSYKDRENADWIDFFPGFRAGLEKEERVALEVLRRLNYARTYNEFTDIVGELPASMQVKELSYFFPAGRKFYSMRILYPLRRLQDIPFTAEYLEVARKDGTLVLVDSFDFTASQDYAKKVPNLYDENDFSWEKQRRGWAVRAYKIMADKDKPADNIVHYIEIFRMKDDLKTLESKPAVRGFLAAGGTKVSMFVVDYDREGTAGYGDPDEIIHNFGEISTAKDIFANSNFFGELFTHLYESQDSNPLNRPERRKQKETPIYSAIVKMGETKIDVWEKGTWTVPFDYKGLVQNMDYSLVKPKSLEEKRLEEKEKLKQIGFFRREFRENGSPVVIEFWMPKDDYAKRDIVEITSFTDTVRLRRKGLSEEIADVEHFGKYPKVILYSYGGKWFKIVDEDGDGVFEKKRLIANPVVAPTPQALY